MCAWISVFIPVDGPSPTHFDFKTTTSATQRPPTVFGPFHASTRLRCRETPGYASPMSALHLSRLARRKRCWRRATSLATRGPRRRSRRIRGKRLGRQFDCWAETICLWDQKTSGVKKQTAESICLKEKGCQKQLLRAFDHSKHTNRCT